MKTIIAVLMLFSTVCVAQEGLYVGGSLGQSRVKIDTGSVFAGIQYDIGQNVGVRAEWEILNNVGDKNTTGGGDIGLLSIGAVYRF